MVFGPYHHRPDPPSYGNVYNPDGSLVSQWPYGYPPKPPKKSKGKKKQQQSRRKRKKVARAKKPKPVRIRPVPGAGSAGKATQAYPTASQATGGAIPVRELDPLAQVGLSGVIVDLVNHGSVSVGHTFQAWQREQDRITNRMWRRPGGLQKPAGL